MKSCNEKIHACKYYQARMSFHVLNKKMKEMNEYTGIKDYIFFSAQFNRW